jgi:hypothetical protein
MANEYNIDFLDPAAKRTRSFTILEQSVNGPGYANQDTDLTLFGRGHLEYGEFVNENFIHLLENWAAPEDIYPLTAVYDVNDGTYPNTVEIAGERNKSFPVGITVEIEQSDNNNDTYVIASSVLIPQGGNPETFITRVSFKANADNIGGETDGKDLVASTTLGRLKHLNFGAGYPDPTIITAPVIGQTWYNIEQDAISTYDGTRWSSAGKPAFGPQPENPNTGELWYDTAYEDGKGPCIGDQLMIWDGAAWRSTAENYLRLDGGTMCGPIDMAVNNISNINNINTINDITTINSIAAVTGNIGSVQKVFLQTDATTGNEAVRKSFADATYINASGDSMAGQLTMVKGTNIVCQEEIVAPAGGWNGNYYEAGGVGSTNLLRRIDPNAPSPLFVKFTLFPNTVVETTIENKNKPANQDANHNIYLPTIDDLVIEINDTIMFIKDDSTSEWVAFSVQKASGKVVASTAAGYDYQYFPNESSEEAAKTAAVANLFGAGDEIPNGFLITVEGHYRKLVYGGNANVWRTATFRQTYIYDSQDSIWRKL